MLQVILFILSVALATVNGWGACYGTSQVSYTTTGSIICGSNASCASMGGCSVTESCNLSRAAITCQDVYQRDGFYYINPSKGTGTIYTNGNYLQSCTGSNQCYASSLATDGSLQMGCYYSFRCDSKCEADSVACVNGGSQWNSDSCKCVQCNQADTTYTEVSCAYDAAKGKYLNLANKVTIINCEATVQENQYYSNTCDSNCTVNSDLTCLGSIDGVNVYMRSCNGKVTKCEADGSCAFAMQKVANGECENPNDPNPTSGSSSSEQGGSSSSGGEPTEWDWLKDSLRVIHETERDSLGAINHNLENIQPFVAGTYDQVTDIAGTVHDINSNLLTGFEFLNDIKENTGNTANNTNNINTKLNTTNSLLESINQKNWHTTVNVSPPEVTVQGDTNIINVSGDTAKSGFEILNYLKRIFGSDTSNNYKPNDTAGTGHVIDSLMGKIGDLVSDSGYLTVRDSVGVAVTSMRGSYNALKDTLAHSAINDSMNRWSEAITNNGVIQGNGSENCPSILNTPFNVKIGTIDYTTTKTIGMYLCTPISPFNVTLWTLARVIVRAIVSISCMIWLYKTVLGIDGGSNEED